MSDTANDNREPLRIPRRRFALGQIISTPGALDACPREYLSQCLARHAGGDWGCVCKEGAGPAEWAPAQASRLCGGYDQIGGGLRELVHTLPSAPGRSKDSVVSATCVTPRSWLAGARGDRPAARYRAA
jgi:hypothetical protein